MKNHIERLAQSSRLSSVILVILLAGCAQKAQVGSVWGEKRVQTISTADHDLFVTDRASKLRIKSTPLPAADQREEFLVMWRGADVRLVKFEYRQANVADTVVALTVPALDRNNHLFSIRGDDYVNGGPVTAWRASLWNGDQLLNEKKSALW